MYGSNFCMRTRRPRCSSSIPIEALVSPLPKELTTPPVTKMCFVMEKNDNEPGVTCDRVIFPNPACRPTTDADAADRYTGMVANHPPFRSFRSPKEKDGKVNLSTAEHLAPISVEDYLAGEEKARRKHEYVDGMVYAMVGGRYAHNLIASNVLAELHSQLKGKPCRALNSDSKVRVQLSSSTRFYYPDASVVCGENLRSGTFQDKPTVIVEVLSQST